MFGNLRLLLAGLGVAAVLALAAGLGLAMERHGEAAATARLQPQLDAANKSIGTLEASLATSEASIAAMRANDARNEKLIAAQEQKIAASDQRAADVAATIRRLQANDQSVAAFLAARIPAALCGVLNDRANAAVACSDDQGDPRAAAVP